MTTTEWFQELTKRLGDAEAALKTASAAVSELGILPAPASEGDFAALRAFRDMFGLPSIGYQWETFEGQAKRWAVQHIGSVAIEQSLCSKLSSSESLIPTTGKTLGLVLSGDDLADARLFTLVRDEPPRVLKPYTSFPETHPIRQRLKLHECFVYRDLPSIVIGEAERRQHQSPPYDFVVGGMYFLDDSVHETLKFRAAQVREKLAIAEAIEAERAERERVEREKAERQNRQPRVLGRVGSW